jgi:hypothetical protein
MNDEEQVPQAGTPAAAADAEKTPAERLEDLGVRGILWQLARDGQIIDVRCEMPQCYCFRGRSYFEPRSARSDWEPTADHYPRLKAHGGHLTPDNVRLAHRLCNRRDYTWRMKINALLGKRMSLEEIAEKLNAEKVPTIHGTNRWTAASVRKAFVPRSARPPLHHATPTTPSQLPSGDGLGYLALEISPRPLARAEQVVPFELVTKHQVSLPRFEGSDPGDPPCF